MTHLRIEQSNVTETVNAHIISKLYDCVYGVDPSNVSLSGYLYSPSVFKDDVDYLREHYGSTLTIVADKTYIKFKDPVVATRMAYINSLSYRHATNSLTGDGIGVTVAEAEDITWISDRGELLFAANNQILTFEEFKYFCSYSSEAFGLNGDSYGMFMQSSISRIDLSNAPAVTAYMFEDCSNLSYIGDITNITKIRQGGFRNCESLSIVVNLPNLTMLEQLAFSRTGITEIVSLGHILNIGLEGAQYVSGNGVFDACNNLTKVDLHTTNSLQTISHHSFASCAALLKVWLPSSVTEIGCFAFEKCRQLMWVKCEATTPPTYYTEAFGLTNSSFKIYVPDASVTTYQAASGWSDFSALIYPLSQFATDFPND